jgi:RHS repeat-associated protein
MLRILHRAFLLTALCLLALATLPAHAQGALQCWGSEGVAGSLQFAEAAGNGCKASPAEWEAMVMGYASANFSTPGPTYPRDWQDGFRSRVLDSQFNCLIDPLPVVKGSRYVCGYSFVGHGQYYPDGPITVGEGGGWFVLRQYNDIPVDTLVSISSNSPLYVGASGIARARVTRDGAPVSGASVTMSGPANCSGSTDEQGFITCAFQAPAMPGDAPLGATCSICSNSAATLVRVLGLPDPPAGGDGGPSGPGGPSGIGGSDGGGSAGPGGGGPGSDRGGGGPDGSGGMCGAPQPAAPNGAMVGNPIRTATGVKVQVELDYLDQSRHPLSFARNYRSDRSDRIESSASGPAGLAGMGVGWRHNFAMALHAAGDIVQLDMEDGTTVTFRPADNGTSGYWQAMTGTDTLEAAPGNTWVYRRASDDSVWRYVAARLASITQRNGWVTTLAGDIAGRPTRVTNQFGRSLTFAYSASGQLASVTTADGQVLRYDFDTQARLAGVTHADGARRAYLYENASLPQALTGIVDERGVRYASFAYDALGRASSTEHAGGVDRYTVSYGNGGSDIGNGTRTVLAPLGAQYGLQYTLAQGVPVISSVSQPSTPGDGDAASRTQNPDGSVATETDFLGVTRRWGWNARQLPSSVSDAVGRPEERTVTTQWHDRLHLPLRITQEGLSIAYTYDNAGNKLSETFADAATGQSRTSAWTYNALGLADTLTDATGGIWRYAYDAAGNRTRVTNPLGKSTSQTFDAAGRMTRRVEANGLASSFTHDLRGRLLTETTAGQTTQYSYTANGQLAGATLPNGYTVSYTYDAAQRLTGASDNNGNSVRYTLDAAGNRIREEVKDARGNLAQVTGRVINALNRITAVQGAAGQTNQFGYDANGEPISQTDPLNQTTAQTLDALHRPTATTFADNASARQAWDKLDQLTQLSDPKGVATQYTYNAFGEVLTETSPDIGSIRYTRNAVGEVTAIQDARGQITSITRDALGRPTQTHYADEQVSLFTYNAVGDVTRMESGADLTTFERDLQGQITLKDQRGDDKRISSSHYRVAYAYENGDLARITYPSGLAIFYRRTNGRITGIDLLEPGHNKLWRPPVLFMTDLAHTALGQPKSWTWRSGDTAQRSFDADGRMVQSEIASYGYDAAGRITAITQSLQAKGTGTAYLTPLAFTAGYDARNRLTSFMRDGSETRYTYDANSNRLTAIDKVTSDTDLENAFANVDVASTTGQILNIDEGSNKLLGFRQTVVRTINGTTTSTVVTPVNFKLDKNGAMTSDGLRSFEYNAAQRLGKVKVSRSGEAASVRYEYNAFGQRVFKSEYEAEQKLPRQAELGSGFIDWIKSKFGWLYTDARTNPSIGTGYVYGDGQIPGFALLGEYDNGSASGAGRTEYIWLPVGNGDVIPVGMYRNGKLFAIHSDHLGTPRLMTDESKAVVWQWPYSAFGNNKPTGVLKAMVKPKSAVAAQAVQLEATPAVEMNLRMPGQYFDVETGQLYNWNRYLTPNAGRYTQNDRIGLDGGSNRFIYGDGDPLSHMDQDGLDWRQKAAEISVCLACLLAGKRVPPQLTPPARPSSVLPASSCPKN